MPPRPCDSRDSLGTYSPDLSFSKSVTHVRPQCHCHNLNLQISKAMYRAQCGTSRRIDGCPTIFPTRQTNVIQLARRIQNLPMELRCMIYEWSTTDFSSYDPTIYAGNVTQRVFREDLSATTTAYTKLTLMLNPPNLYWLSPCIARECSRYLSFRSDLPPLLIDLWTISPGEPLRLPPYHETWFHKGRGELRKVFFEKSEAQRHGISLAVNKDPAGGVIIHATFEKEPQALLPGWRSNIVTEKQVELGLVWEMQKSIRQRNGCGIGLTEIQLFLDAMWSMDGRQKAVRRSLFEELEIAMANKWEGRSYR
ncbi:hypothetical protein K461DRAFT_307922 [Myriangium duriaei CBS 260.36]|uniref:Uncharacterized protein n=1 Tax=Myriangium duriaei CBS 260.36 TaxID=1168546 RepID=A0A9P4IZF4_9PEZI|nr:hypothetical protein K461DRAFT_307922 [Myriangium duriaei CBS 260.36]